MTKYLDLDQVGSFDVADKLFKDINDFVKEKVRDHGQVVEDCEVWQCEGGTRVSWSKDSISGPAE